MSALPSTQGLAALTGALDARPQAVFAAALVLIAVGALVAGVPDGDGVVLGGTSAWLLWAAGITILAIWALLSFAGRAITGLLVAGVTAAISGAFLFYNPQAGALAVAILIVSSLVMDGGVQLALALKLRPAGAWRWIFASAMASVIAAAALASGSVNGWAAWGPLVGIALITSGLALLLLGPRARPEASAPE